MYNPTEQTPFLRSQESLSWSRNYPALTKMKGSLLFTIVFHWLFWARWIHIQVTTYFTKIQLNVILQLCLNLPSDSYYQVFQLECCTHLIFPTRSTCPTHPICFNLFIPIFGKVWSFLLCNFLHPPVTVPLLGLNISSVLFLLTLSNYIFSLGWETKFHMEIKKKAELQFAYFNLHISQKRNGKMKDFEQNGSRYSPSSFLCGNNFNLSLLFPSIWTLLHCLEFTGSYMLRFWRQDTNM